MIVIENVIWIDQRLILNFQSALGKNLKPPSCATSPPVGDGAQLR